MKSLTTRLSLLFMLASMGVLSLAAVLFHQLSEHHFKVLDQQTLKEKAHAAQAIIRRSNSGDFDVLRPSLSALLSAHHDLTTLILAADGEVLFADPTPMPVPEDFRRATVRRLWEWETPTQRFRGITARLEVPDGPPLTLLMLLDVTAHASFFETLRWWFWGVLALCGTLSAGLGWAVARSGLRPVRQLTAAATGVSARSLHARLPQERVPTELQQLVEAFNAMLARLDEAFVRLSNFSADIAHELRTPVASLMTHTEVTLSRPRTPTEYQETLYSNLDDLQRMARMIDDMLFLAKADNGLIVPQRQPVSLAAVVTKLFDYYQLLAEERGIALQLEGDGQVMGDRLMLDRALSNLLSNALRYTPDGQAIRVQIGAADEALHLTLSNPGPTIPPDQLGRIFDRFYRADPARREGNPGNAGLGLALTRSIVEAHQGSISCQSLDSVTTFTLSMPSQDKLPTQSRSAG